MVIIPRLKATFTLSLARPKEYTSLGNMPLKEEGVVMKEEENYIWDNYEKSLIMSTYLLKWVVSKYSNAESLTKRNITVRAYYGKNKTKSLLYAAKSGAKILDYLEKVLNMEYQLPKMDMVAVPFFRTRTLHEWGLMSFYYTFLLYEEDHNTHKYNVDQTISHSLVHQWAGNLVTSAW